MTNTKQNSVFQDFTREYALSKTLRFELRPVGNTREMLDAAGVFEKDRIIKEKYERTKPYFDRLHREFVQESLSDVALTGVAEYLSIFSEWRTDKKDKTKAKQLSDIEKSLRNEVTRFFEETAKIWAEKYSSIKIKKSGIDFLFEEGIFRVLKERYGNEDDAFVEDDAGNRISIFDQWKGFVGYFTKFYETRKNFYKDDGKASRIATRIVDENLKRFCDNIIAFDRLKQVLDLSEVQGHLKDSLTEVFSPRFYDECLLRQGIDRYNTILGGDSMDQNVKGINQYVNKYLQDHKGERLPFLKPLDKQILSEKESFLEGIESDGELLSVLELFQKNAGKKVGIFRSLMEKFVSKNDAFDLSKIYLSKEGFNTISRKWTDNTRDLESSLHKAMKADKPTGLSYDKTEDLYKFPDHIALSYLQEAISAQNQENTVWKERYYKTEENSSGVLFGNESVWEQFLHILSFEISSLYSTETTHTIAEKEDFATALINAERFEEVFSSDSIVRTIQTKVGYDVFEQKMTSVSGPEFGPDEKVFIKNYADSVLRIYQMAKYFSLEKKGVWNEEYELDSFYSEPEHGYLVFHENVREEIVKVYDALRNYLTKKPYSEEKWKLNFENPTLADGWDKNKESDNSAVILRKDGQYYLGVMKKGKTHIFSERNEKEMGIGGGGMSYEKMVYKLFPDPAKMMPKVCFSAKGLEFFNPPADIMEIYEKGTFKKGENFDIGSMRRLIDFYKECLALYPGWKGYDFSNVKESATYVTNIGEFYSDVAKAGYKVEFVAISESYVGEKNEAGELYLFEIHNKDWNLKDSKRKDGAKNLHTLYFESLFSEENVEADFPMKLNGQAELFYRPATATDKLGFKKNADGTDMVGKNGQKVVNHKRYSEDKILFHVPMTMNRGAGNIYRFNDEINELLAGNPAINIIGVDRGEKHLAYYSVINQKGEVLESGSLNTVNGIDYAGKLDERAKGREQARKDWQAVEGIKDLKKGYVSQVVRKLADLAIEYNAIIVLEDLNMRFKQIRGGIEKSAYQQLEKALIDKLSFLVEKGEKDSESAGHLLRAYQLAAPFESFQEIGKQTGIIFYTQASYTSKIDPATGWRPNLYFKYTSAKKAKEDIERFDAIHFRDGYFEFSYDLGKIVNSEKGATIFPERTDWTVGSCVERYRWNRKLNAGKGGYDYYSDLTEDFRSLFTSVGIGEEGDIKAQIAALDSEGNERFFRDFIFFFSLICQIRNTDPDAKDPDKADFILSPVAPFFDSRTPEAFGTKLPKNGDDNGAYNIARKGIIILDKISDYKRANGSCKNLGWGGLYISHAEWDDFARKNALKNSG